jgi:ribosomal protein S18 acetylase RimI-like enzyme
MFQKKLSSGSREEIPCEIRILNKSHLPQMMELQKMIIENLLRKETLHPFPADFMEEHLGAKGFVLGVLSGNEILAFRNVYFPDKDDAEWNLGIDLGLPAEDLNRVANLQMVCVHPSFRGNSIASIMNMHAISIIREMGIHNHVCATVSPYNFWNIKILLGSGFAVKRLTKKYNGKLRYIVHQNLGSQAGIESGCSQSVSLSDFIRQKKLLKSGWIGTDLHVSRKDALIPCYENMLLTFLKPEQLLYEG